MRHDSEHKVGKVVEKDEGGCLHRRQAGNCRGWHNRRDAAEERARSASKAGVRLTVAKRPILVYNDACIGFIVSKS